MEKGKRRKILNLVKEKLESKLFFGTVLLQAPSQAVPSATGLPSVFIFREDELMERLTNTEKRSMFGVGFVLYVEADTDIELVKADAQDVLEDALIELQIDAAFTALAVQILVQSASSGPLALAPLGLGAGVFPPYGAIRISAVVMFDYQAVT